jgi:fructose-1,6-bisphosphatase/inositol monophosphatase family enzyme
LTPEEQRRLLCALGNDIRSRVAGAGTRLDASTAVYATAADTIYLLDQVADDELVAWFDRHWPFRTDPVLLVSEGLDTPVLVGDPHTEPRWTCIVDPVDGTRGLMYDKRPAWALAAVAPFGGSLRDVVAAAMTELPTSKQWASDQLSAVRGGGLVATRTDVRKPGATPATIAVRPSAATTLDHGWASFARFFPAAKPLLAAFEETLWRELYGAAAVPGLAVFDDQYLSTGGQFHELLVGHDRMLGDLRPLAFATLGLDTALSCHPYDCCTVLLLEEAGCVVTDPRGAPLDAPLDTTSPVAWVGFANPALAAHVRPALDRALAAHF